MFCLFAVKEFVPAATRKRHAEHIRPIYSGSEGSGATRAHIYTSADVAVSIPTNRSLSVGIT